MDESLAGFLEAWGEPTQRIKADESVLAALAHRVPPLLIGYWRHLGFSVFRHGLMTLCNPLEWKPLVDEWIRGTELERRDVFIPVMKGVRGNFHLFGITRGLRFELSPINEGYIGFRTAPQKPPQSPPHSPFDVSVRELFTAQPGKFLPVTDREDFLKVFREHAPFAANEMLGYVPSLPMGGTRNHTNLQKVGAFSYLSMLRQVSGELKEVMEHADIHK